jgi:methyltransferase (TIGR00027 family)
VCRCRYIDDYLQRCLENGTGQWVILGAGFDSRAYRQDALAAQTRIFEVDYPSTQASKIERVQKIVGKLPDNVAYVSIDFNHENLDQLLASGFDPSLKTLFIWEGVTLYLDSAAVDATLAWVHAHASPGSAIIFDYQDLSTLTRPHRAYQILNRLTGERRVFGIEKGQIAEFLTRRGFTNVVDANAGQLEQLYCNGSNRRRTVASYYSIVHAEVGENQDDFITEGQKVLSFAYCRPGESS